MPFIDLVSKDDRVSLWYTTNTPMGGTSDFDQTKPTVIMLHPLFLDSSWLNTQMEDPRLNERYNIVAFDMRTCGRSIATPSGKHDTWVDAADLAFAHLALGLPPAHFFAVECISVNAALRLAALFPEMCLSLTLVNVPPPTELEWVFETYGELLNMWCHPQDLDEFEHALSELTQYMLGKDSTPELRDEIIAFWSTRYPPWRRRRVYETMHCMLNRTPLSEAVLAAVTQPTMIIQADSTDINPLKYAEKLASDLINVRDGGARVRTIKGSPEYVTLIPTCASVVNRVFAEFLSRQPKGETPSQLQCIHPSSRRERILSALEKLADLIEDPNIASRDPSSSLSFSCVTPEVYQSQKDILDKEVLEERTAFSPLGLDGRPLRRHSERYIDHWFQAPKEEATKRAVVNKDEKYKLLVEQFAQTEHRARAAAKDDAFDHLSATKPVSSEVARTGRLRRQTLTKHIVEKATINGAGNNFAPAIIQNTVRLGRLGGH